MSSGVPRIGTNLSISIRGPKPVALCRHQRWCTNLSISIREPKLIRIGWKTYIVQIYQYPSENRNNNVIDNHSLKYKFINIHQRTETGITFISPPAGTNLSISIREPKLKIDYYLDGNSTNLSISIREPKLQDKNCRKSVVYKFINIHQRTETAR